MRAVLSSLNLTGSPKSARISSPRSGRLDSSGGSNPDLELEIFKTVECHTNFCNAVKAICPVLKHQMELLDDVDVAPVQTLTFNSTSKSQRDIVASENSSLLYDISRRFFDMKSTYVSDSISRVNSIDDVLSEVEKTGEVNVKDGMIFPKRGGPKVASSANRFEERRLSSSERIRRMSFVSTEFGDKDRILNKDTLLSMSDLNYLLSMNAYYLPYMGDMPKRSMYQTFFTAFVNTVFGTSIENVWKTDISALKFYTLQELIYQVCMVTEYYVSLFECIFEIIKIVNQRLKAFPQEVDPYLMSCIGVNISGINSIGEYKDIILEHLVSCFESEDRIFSQFKSRRLLKSINLERDSLRKSSSWDGRPIEAVNEAFQDAIMLYKQSSSVFSAKVKEISNIASQLDDSTSVQLLLSGISMYFFEFEGCLGYLADQNKTYNALYRNSIALMDILNVLESKYPIKYGASITPRILRGLMKSPTHRRTSSIDSSGENTTSPRNDSSKTSSGDESTSNKGSYK
jgi:hypothetical protein